MINEHCQKAGSFCGGFIVQLDRTKPVPTGVANAACILPRSATHQIKCKRNLCAIYLFVTEGVLRLTWNIFSHQPSVAGESLRSLKVSLLFTQQASRLAGAKQTASSHKYGFGSYLVSVWVEDALQRAAVAAVSPNQQQLLPIRPSQSVRPCMLPQSMAIVKIHSHASDFPR